MTDHNADYTAQLEELLADWYEQWWSGHVLFSTRMTTRNLLTRVKHDANWGAVHPNGEMHPFDCEGRCLVRD